LAVRVPTGVTAQDISRFQHYCRGERSANSLSTIEVYGKFLVREPLEGGYRPVDKLPENCYIY
jgi:hypothetical protein